MPRPLVLEAVFLAGCQRDSGTITAAVALLPGQLPVYRSVVDAFERTSGHRVVVVPQQYADIRRALAAEATAGRGTLDRAVRNFKCRVLVVGT